MSMIGVVLLLTGHLTVTILYEIGGQEVGVGEGALTFVEQDNGQYAAFCQTGPYSSCEFDLPYAHYAVRSYPQRTSPFFKWVCEKELVLDNSNEVLVIHCVRRFDLRLPNLRKWLGI